MLENPFMYALIITLVIQFLFFIAAALFKTDKVTDLSYTLTFAIVALLFLIKNKNPQVISLITTALILLWSIRLGSYLFIRILKMKKDARFDGIREDFFRFAKFWFFQGLTIWIILLPSIILLTTKEYYSSFLTTGLSIWFIGFLMETVADYQKFKFKNKNKKKWVNVGLWKYARHPNYFAEMLCWWALFIIAIPYLNGFEWLVIIGPIYLTVILRFVSGVPLLERQHEKKFGKLKEYKEYKKKTNLLIPFPK